MCAASSSGLDDLPVRRIPAGLQGGDEEDSGDAVVGGSDMTTEKCRHPGFK